MPTRKKPNDGEGFRNADGIARLFTGRAWWELPSITEDGVMNLWFWVTSQEGVEFSGRGGFGCKVKSLLVLVCNILFKGVWPAYQNSKQKSSLNNKEM